jgi:hypothetical protein
MVVAIAVVIGRLDQQHGTLRWIEMGLDTFNEPFRMAPIGRLLTRNNGSSRA